MTSRRLAWLASTKQGVPLGSAFLRLFVDAGQSHLAELELAVHPAERRQGIGSLLLEAAVAAARKEGRRSIVAEADGDSPGSEFSAATGFRRVLTLTYARLDLSTADTQSLRASADTTHSGCRLVSWDGVVPDYLADTYAASRVAMDDMPMDETDYGTVTWDVARVRAVAQAVLDRGDLLHTVAAIDSGTGAIVGFTELVVSGDGRGDGQYYGTAVQPSHRGRGLARWMKFLSIAQARDSYPELAGLVTDTAESNTPMRQVNQALGFVPTHQALTYQLDL